MFIKNYFMKTIKNDSVVRVNYTGRLEDGSIFDTSLSEGRNPLDVFLGQGSLIPGFEEALVGMNEGETKTVEIMPDKGYGDRIDALVFSIEKDKLPQDIEVGGVVQGNGPAGTAIFTITEIGDSTVTLDGNHPLAGKKMIFDLEVVEII